MPFPTLLQKFLATLQSFCFRGSYDLVGSTLACMHTCICNAGNHKVWTDHMIGHLKVKGQRLLKESPSQEMSSPKDDGRPAIFVFHKDSIKTSSDEYVTSLAVLKDTEIAYHLHLFPCKNSFIRHTLPTAPCSHVCALNLHQQCKVSSLDVLKIEMLNISFN